MKITVIGGGTAGWLAAMYILRRQPAHKVTVIDSTKLGIIGVGEGTTGKFMDIIQGVGCDYGINERDFIQSTDAVPKMGIKFTNWRGQGETWISPIDNTPTMNQDLDQCLVNWVAERGIDQMHLSTPAGVLGAHNLSPIVRSQAGTWGQGAYHFDGHKVGAYFRKITEPLCERVLDSEITGWQLDPITGNVKSVALANGETLEADYWIDASGFARVLAPAVDPGWHSYRDSLTCDRVALFRTQHWHLRDTIEPWTLAAAMDSGWRFRIPTQDRYGNGYVFDSSTASDQQIADELHRLNPKIDIAKFMSFEPGRMERPYSKNVAFIGLSSVFLEPLQATSIHGTIAQLQHLEAHILRPTSIPQGDWANRAANEVITQTFDQYADLLQVHYRSGRTDTEFWRRQTYDVDVRERVAHLRELTQRRWPNSGDFYLQRGVAGYPVFIYPILAYGWIPKDIIQSLRTTAPYLQYHAEIEAMRQDSITVNELIRRAKNQELPDLPWLPKPRVRPVNSLNRLHPLLR